VNVPTVPTGGRKLAGAEGKRSVLRVNQTGIHLMSLDKVVVDTDNVEMIGNLIAKQDLQVQGSLTAKQDLQVEGKLVPTGGVDLSKGKTVGIAYDEMLVPSIL
jgi:hypothetical protein